MSAPSFREHDASLSLWIDDPKDPMVQKARDEVVRLLRSLGWRVRIDPHTQKRYPSIAKDHHASLGDLQAHIEISGRQMQVTFYQDVVHENKNGGRYDFDKREKMPYLLGLKYEATVRKVAACIEGLGLPKLERRKKRTGSDFIQHARAELEAFQGADFYADTPEAYPRYNCMAADKTQLRDGQRVWFVAEYEPDGRWLSGIAWRNINNMWWVLLPGDVVRNVASFELHTTPPGNPRGRRFSAHHKRRVIEGKKADAVRAENYERAAKLRDALKAISQEGSAA